MKIICLFLFLSIAAYGEDWTVNGTAYHEVKVVKAEADVVTILDSDGGAKIAISSLSPELKKRFNYDPIKAAMAAKQREIDDANSAQVLATEKKRLEKIQQDQKAESTHAFQERQEELAKVQAKKAEEENIKKSTMHLLGNVIQKVPEGYLVRAEPPDQQDTGVPVGISKNSDGTWSSSAMNARFDKGGLPIVQSSTIFVITPNKMVDGDPINMLIYPDGEFTYTNTLGAVATVRKYNEVPISVFKSITASTTIQRRPSIDDPIPPL